MIEIENCSADIKHFLYKGVTLHQRKVNKGNENYHPTMLPSLSSKAGFFREKPYNR